MEKPDDNLIQLQKLNALKYRNQNYEWMLNYKNIATHAVTLTFDPSKVYSFMRQHEIDLALNSEYMIRQYQDEMRYFANILNKSLFGNASKRHQERMSLIPVFEDLCKNKVPHYHCVIGVDQSRVDAVPEKVEKSWQRTRFCGHYNDVRPFRDEGWISYITKQCFTPDIEVIDWQNIRVPASSQSTPE